MRITLLEAHKSKNKKTITDTEVIKLFLLAEFRYRHATWTYDE